MHVRSSAEHPPKSRLRPSGHRTQNSIDKLGPFILQFREIPVQRCVEIVEFTKAFIDSFVCVTELIPYLWVVHVFEYHAHCLDALKLLVCVLGCPFFVIDSLLSAKHLEYLVSRIAI